MADILRAVLTGSPTDLRGALQGHGCSNDVLCYFGIFAKLAEERDEANSGILLNILQEFACKQQLEAAGVHDDGQHVVAREENRQIPNTNIENSVLGCDQTSDNESTTTVNSSEATGIQNTKPNSKLCLDAMEPELDITKCLQYLVAGTTVAALDSLLKAGLPSDFRDRERKTLLHHAAAMDAVEHLRLLLKQGADVDAEDLQRVRPLMVACRSDSDRVFFQLLSQTMDINHTDLCQQTALHCACKANAVTCAQGLINKSIKLGVNMHQETELMVALAHNAEDVVPLLLAYGVDVNAKTRQSVTALHYAAKYDCPKAAKFLCNAMPKVKATAQDRHGYTALAVAAKNGHLEVVKILLQYNGSRNHLNMETKTQNTALDLAAMMGHHDCSDVLANAGADINIGTVLIHTAQGGHLDTMALLIRKYKERHGADYFLCNLEQVSKVGMAPIHVAALYGYDKCVKLLLDEGANPCQSMVATDETSLMLAAAKDYHKVVDLLLESIIQEPGRCGLNQHSNKRKTALHYAATAGAVNCVKSLLRAGVQINLKDSHGFTPLLLAVERGHTDVVQLLIKGKCDVNAQRKHGWNGLHLAALSDSADCGACLLNAGLKPDTCSWISQVSPAVLAAKKGHLAVLKLLLDCGASVDLADCDGLTPLHHAAKNNRISCLSLLIQRGADVNRRASNLLTAIEMAAHHGNLSAIRVLVYYNADVSHLCPLMDPCESSTDYKDTVWILSQAAGCHKRTSRSGCLDLTWDSMDAKYQLLTDPNEEVQFHQMPLSLRSLCRATIKACMSFGLEFRNDLHMLPIPNDIRLFIGMDREIEMDVDT